MIRDPILIPSVVRYLFRNLDDTLTIVVECPGSYALCSFTRNDLTPCPRIHEQRELGYHQYKSFGILSNARTPTGKSNNEYNA